MASARVNARCVILWRNSETAIEVSRIFGWIADGDRVRMLFSGGGWMPGIVQIKDDAAQLIGKKGSFAINTGWPLARIAPSGWAIVSEIDAVAISKNVNINQKSAVQ